MHRLAAFVLALAIALAAPLASAHPAAPTDGYTRVLHDCDDDHAAHGATEQGHGLVALDVREETQDGKRLVVVRLIVDDTAAGDTSDTREEIAFATTRKSGADAIRTTIETSDGGSPTLTYVEGTKPMFLQAEPHEPGRSAFALGYTYEQLALQNGEPLHNVEVTASYRTTEQGAWTQGDYMPGGHYEEGSMMDLTCGENDPVHFIAAGFTATASDWTAPPGTDGSTTGSNRMPLVDFTFTPAAASTRDDIVFTDQSADLDGNITAWQWDFGDGNASTTKNPTHRYGDNGTYTVTLTVRDSGGATRNTTRTISVLNSAPTAVWGIADLPAVATPIAFRDDSVDPDGRIVAWSWAFGDGATSTAPTPTHEYAQPGTYDVTLTVTDDDGATSTTTRPLDVSAESVRKEKAPANGPFVALLAIAGLLLALRRRTW